MHCKHCDVELVADDRGHGKINECRACAVDVERYVGHMIWDHKTAPVIEIHANKASLSALKDGRYNEGLSLVHEVKERSRRREGDCGVSSKNLAPYKHAQPKCTVRVARDNIKPIQVRAGSGKTFTSFSASQIRDAKTCEQLRNRLSGEKYEALLRCTKLPHSVRNRKRIDIWKDENGLYIKPAHKKRHYHSSLDAQTLRSLGYRGANYRRT